MSVTTVGTWVTDWTNDVFVVAIQDAVGGFLGNIGAGTIVTDLVGERYHRRSGSRARLRPADGDPVPVPVQFLKTAATWFVSHSSWTVYSVTSRLSGGKSFIPLLILIRMRNPGIMASKTIEQDNDRRLTIMTATFIPCGAKLPVIALMGGVIAGAAGGYSRDFLYRSADVLYRDCGQCLCLRSF